VGLGQACASWPFFSIINDEQYVICPLFFKKEKQINRQWVACYCPA